MSREEAMKELSYIIDEMPSMECADWIEAISMAIKALEQTSILDKIRAEIDKEYDRVHPYDISCAEGLEMALNIIDKYKVESEG